MGDIITALTELTTAPAADDQLPLVDVSDTTQAASGTTKRQSWLNHIKHLFGSRFAEDAGANDTYVVTLAPAPAAYVTGEHYRFKANTANTGACTVNFNSLGAKTIKKAAGGITTDLTDNDIRAGQWVDLVYDGTNMQMQSLLGNAPAGGAGGIGDVVGPASATDNALARYDSTTGKLIQNSAVLVDDDGALTIPEIAAPATPAAGKVVVYAKSDNKVYRKGEDGVEAELGGGSGIGGSTGASDNRILRADGAGGATVQASAVSIGDNGDTLPVTTSASDLGGASNRWKQFWADDIIASGTGAAGGRIRFFGSGGGAAEIGSNANRKSLNFTDGINGNPGTICLRPHTPAQFGANQNDYTEEGGNSAAYFRWSSDASQDVTGLSISQADGDIHVIINVGSNDIVLKHESASSSAVNRFLCSTGADITLSANQSAEIWYDGTTQRWRVWKKP